MKNLFVLTSMVLLCLLTPSALAQPTANYILNETAPGTWDLLVDVTGVETAGLSAYEVWVDGVAPASASFTQNTLATASAGFMPGTLVQGDIVGNFNAANYQGAAISGGVAIQGIGKTAVSEAGPPAVNLDAQALLGTLSTPGGLGEADFRVTTAGLLNMAGDGFLNTDLLVPTMEVIPYVLAFLPGDANKDGVVSAGDYASVQAAFGNTGAADGSLVGDANGDGVVSAGDYASVQANFGNTTPPVEAVPEPATIFLLALGGVAVLRRKK